MPDVTSDMPPHEIMYQLRQNGVTYADLDAKYGFPPRTCANAVLRPESKGEVAIAAELGKKPKDIWPSRYDANGRRLRPQPAENYTHKPAVAKRQKDKAA